MRLIITYLIVTTWVFAIVATAHGVRLYTGADLMWNDAFIPMWASWVALVVSLLLTIKGFYAVKYIRQHVCCECCETSCEKCE